MFSNPLPSRSNLGKFLASFIAVALCCSASASLSGQQNDLADPLNLGGFGESQPFAGLQQDEPKVVYEASFTVDPNDPRLGELRVTAIVLEGWHTFSTTQPPGGPNKTTLKIKPGFSGARLAGEFVPERDPDVHYSDVFDIDAEQFEGSISWVAPIQIDEPSDSAELTIPVEARGQACTNDDSSCVQVSGDPVAERVVGLATFSGEFTDDDIPATIRGWVSHKGAIPGEPISLVLILDPADGYRIPAWSNRGSTESEPTFVTLALANGAELGEPEITGAGAPAESTVSTEGDSKPVFYDQTVRLEFPLTISETTDGGKPFKGWLALAPTATDAERSEHLSAVQFEFRLSTTDEAIEGENPLEFSVPSNGDYAAVAKSVNKAWEQQRAAAGAFADYNLSVILVFAFLAGLILNVMPCVLPVIGIKILSFVQQAGENPRRVLMLNLVFALGIISVFMLLASLASFPQVIGLREKLGWGGLFQSQAFVITMVAVVFAFGLSFLGVWEIPIPGFVTTAGSGKAAQKEGYTGAFLKGVLTTLLATPCSGPMLIPAVTWATAQPPLLTFLVFLALGLGMASPFIIIGFRPSLVSWLPKPGEWMETFKQWMGFVLIGGAIFFYNAVSTKLKLSVLVLMLFIGVATWLAGKISFVDPASVRMRKWAGAVGTFLAGLFIAFYLMIPQHELEWQPFAKIALEDEIAAGNIVFVDFTADW